jgi:hypothetical protein
MLYSSGERMSGWRDMLAEDEGGSGLGSVRAVCQRSEQPHPWNWRFEI